MYESWLISKYTYKSFMVTKNRKKKLVDQGERVITLAKGKDWM